MKTHGVTEVNVLFEDTVHAGDGPVMPPGGMLVGSSIRTFTGKWVDPFDFKPWNIDIRDIAHALARLCRFTGHTNGYYSVAEHCVRVSRKCSPDNALWGLLHDAAEAYLGDVSRPLKCRPEYAFFRRAEADILRAVADRYDLPHEVPHDVIALDDEFGNRELKTLVLGHETDGWACEVAEDRYLAAFSAARELRY